MGGIDKGRFRHYKSLLALSDEAIELADRHGLDEFHLRHVLRLPTDVQAEMIQHIVQFNLTGKQVKEICEKGLSEDMPPAEVAPSPKVRSFIKSMKRIDDNDREEFVRGLLTGKKRQRWLGPVLMRRLHFSNK
jgi:hypothetical protein